MKAYLVDVGVLLSKDDREFEYYAVVYDKLHGYYDEGQCYMRTQEEALKYAKEYVQNGVENTYAVISNTVLPDDFDFDEGCVEDEEYEAKDVVYSVAKIDGEIVENFVNKDAPETGLGIG